MIKMTRRINMYKGIVLPVDAKEGKIDIIETASVNGAEKKPVLQYPVKPGDAVVLTDELQVTKADGTNGVIIGFVHDNPEFSVDPTQNYTQAQAISAGMLRRCGVETTFVDIRTVPAKASEGITAGKYVEFSTDGFKLTSSSGATESNFIALTDQTTANTVVVGIK